MNLDDHLAETDRLTVRVKITMRGRPTLTVSLDDATDWDQARRFIDHAKVSYYRHLDVVKDLP